MRLPLKPEIDLVALLLATIALTSQVVSCTHGARIQMIPPEKFVLYSLDSALGQKSSIQIAAPVSYVNKAEASFGSAIVREHAIFEIGGLKSEQLWYGFAKDISDDGKGNISVIDAREPPVPVPLPGQSAISRIVLFTGQSQNCFARTGPCGGATTNLSAEALLGQAKVGEQMRLTIIADDIDGDPHSASCIRTLTKAIKAELDTLPRRTVYLACAPE